LILGALIVLIYLSGCTKVERDLIVPTENQAISRDSDDPLTSSSITVVNGLIRFQDYSAYKAYRAVSDISYDSSYCETLKNRFPEFFLDSTHFYQSTMFTKIFEVKHNFKSLESKYEEDLDLFLRTGGDPVNFDFGKQLPQVISTYLNVHSEYMIGNLIFKYLNKEKIAVVTNSDFNSLYKLRQLPPEDIQSTINIYVCNTAIEDFDHNQFFQLNANGEIVETIEQVCNPKFIVNSIDINSTYLQLSNQTTGLDPNQNYNFTWYINGNTFPASGVGQFQNFPISYFSWPITIRLYVQGPGCSAYTDKILKSPCDLFTIGIGVSAVSPGRSYSFLPLPSPSGTCPNCVFSWDFGNGQTYVGAFPPIIVYGSWVLDPATVTLTVTFPSGCTAIVQRTIEVGCEKKSGIGGPYEYRLGNRKIVATHQVFYNGFQDESYFEAGTFAFRKTLLWHRDLFASINSTVSGRFFPNCNIVETTLSNGGVYGNPQSNAFSSKVWIIKSEPTDGGDIRYKGLTQVFTSHTGSDGTGVMSSPLGLAIP
jgi:hypothetical protein